MKLSMKLKTNRRLLSTIFVVCSLMNSCPFANAEGAQRNRGFKIVTTGVSPSVVDTFLKSLGADLLKSDIGESDQFLQFSKGDVSISKTIPLWNYHNKNYFNSMHFEQFDKIIIVVGNRITEGDVYLADRASKLEISAAIVKQISAGNNEKLYREAQKEFPNQKLPDNVKFYVVSMENFQENKALFDNSAFLDWFNTRESANSNFLGNYWKSFKKWLVSFNLHADDFLQNSVTLQIVMPITSVIFSLATLYCVYARMRRIENRLDAINANANNHRNENILIPEKIQNNGIENVGILGDEGLPNGHQSQESGGSTEPSRVDEGKISSIGSTPNTPNFKSGIPMVKRRLKPT